MKHRAPVLMAGLLLALTTALPAAGADPARPFGGSWIGVDGYDFAAAGCPIGAFMRFSTSGQAEFPHLGLTTITTTHCTYFDFAGMAGSYDQGVTTLTAANGDTLTVAEEGTFTVTPNPAGPPPFATATCASEWTVTGGTGRFAHASGSGTGTSFDDMITGIQKFHLTGSISY